MIFKMIKIQYFYRINFKLVNEAETIIRVANYLVDKKAEKLGKMMKLYLNLLNFIKKNNIECRELRLDPWLYEETQKSKMNYELKQYVLEFMKNAIVVIY